MSDNRNITVNILPQAPQAWYYISIAVFFISVALGLQAWAGCAEHVQAAESQARAHR